MSLPRTFVEQYPEENPGVPNSVAEDVLNETPILKGQVIYTDSPSGKWDKVWDVLGPIFRGAETAAKVYADAMSKRSTSLRQPAMPNLYYEPTNVHFDANPVSYRQINIAPPQGLGAQAAKRVAQLQEQADQVAVQHAHQQATNLLAQISRAQGLPTYQEFHAQHGISYPVPSGRGSLGVQKAEMQPQMRTRIYEDQRQIQSDLQAAQNRLNALDQMLKNQSQATNVAPQLPIIKPVQPSKHIPQQSNRAQQKSLQASIQKANLDVIAEKAFYDPRNPDQDLLQQTQDKQAIAGSKLEQVELNLARLHSQGKVTKNQAQSALAAMQLATATNWLKNNDQLQPNGTVTYRGMTVPKRFGPLLTYADTQHYLDTDRHLTPRDNWQQFMLNSGQNLLGGMAHGVSAGGAFKSKNDLMFAAGDLIGTVGANIGLIAGTAGAGTPAALAFYWGAREANREMQAGKPLNPVAIGGSGVLGAMPGSVVTKSTLGTAGRIGAGAALGYGQDIGTRAVEQLGDTGKVDLRKIDYHPGLGTVAGGLLAHPQISEAFNKYIGERLAALHLGRKVPLSYEDFVRELQKQHGWTAENIAYLENKGGKPPQNFPFNRPLWSPGKENNPLKNAHRHASDHPGTFNLPPGDPSYVQKVHDLLDNLPVGTELMETKSGMKRYFSPNASPDGQPVFTVEEPSRAPRSAYIPDGNLQAQYDYFLNQGGKYKGKIK